MLTKDEHRKLCGTWLHMEFGTCQYRKSFTRRISNIVTRAWIYL